MLLELSVKPSEPASEGIAWDELELGEVGREAGAESLKLVAEGLKLVA
jgi:hypothetical protein